MILLNSLVLFTLPIHHFQRIFVAWIVDGAPQTAGLRSNENKIEMAKQIIVTINDYHRLMGLLEFASLMGKLPDIQSRLYTKLVSAKTLPPGEIDDTIITMNSRVRLKDMNNQRDTEITLTYPREALPTERKISIFSEIGIALFGRREKEVASWKVPDGIGLFEIVKVTYQPEAAGDYHL